MKTPQCEENRRRIYRHGNIIIYELKSVLSICRNCECYLHTENTFEYCLDKESMK